MQLTKHTDGSWRSSDGYAAVVMLRTSGTDADGNSVFEFVVDHFGPPIRIVWHGDATLVDARFAPKLIAKGWARNLSEQEAHAAVLDKPDQAAEGEADSTTGEFTTATSTDTAHDPSPAHDVRGKRHHRRKG